MIAFVLSIGLPPPIEISVSTEELAFVASVAASRSLTGAWALMEENVPAWREPRHISTEWRAAESLRDDVVMINALDISLGSDFMRFSRTAPSP